MPFEQLSTPRLIIRRFHPDDLIPFLAYRNHPDVARYQTWEHLDEAYGRAFMEEMQTCEPAQIGWVNLAIELKSTGALIGDCALHIFEDDARLAEIGYSLDPTYQGQGYATEAVQRLLEYCFGELALHRITATLDVLNIASAKLVERLGFRREGHFRQNIWFKGAWGDEYLYAILREEFLGATPHRPE